MADRRYGPRPAPPFRSRWWSYAVQCTGEPGIGGITCPRCKTSAELELSRDELPLIGGPPVTVKVTCSACQLVGLIVLEPPAATRPPATFLRDRPDRPAPRPIRPPSDLVTPIGSPPVADPPIEGPPTEGPLLTLAEWQAQGVAEGIHPNTAARVPRATDERPGRRDQHDRRLYSRSEIEQAIELHQQQQQQGLQHNHDQAAADADGGEVQP